MIESGKDQHRQLEVEEKRSACASERQTDRLPIA